MTVAEWIIMVILAATLLIFLILGITLLIKLIKFTNTLNRIAASGQRIADNVKDFTSASVVGLIRGFASDYMNSRQTNNSKKGGNNGKK